MTNFPFMYNIAYSRYAARKFRKTIKSLLGNQKMVELIENDRIDLWIHDGFFIKGYCKPGKEGSIIDLSIKKKLLIKRKYKAYCFTCLHELTHARQFSEGKTDPGFYTWKCFAMEYEANYTAYKAMADQGFLWCSGYLWMRWTYWLKVISAIRACQCAFPIPTAIAFFILLSTPLAHWISSAMGLNLWGTIFHTVKRWIPWISPQVAVESAKG